jgi:DDE superfamily endonuclease
VRASEQDRPDVAAARTQWRHALPTLDPERLVFLDESGVATDLLRRYGRSPRGTRVHDHAPHHHWQTSTFVAGLRVDGLTAPGLLDGPLDGDSFLAYVDQVLVPTLRPGDVVVMDNLSAHHVDGVRARIERAYALLLYLPPYSPDFNPIDSGSPSSRRYCARHAAAPSRNSGGRSGSPSRASPPPSAGTISVTAAIQPLHACEIRASIPSSLAWSQVHAAESHR